MQFIAAIPAMVQAIGAGTTAGALASGAVGAATPAMAAASHAAIAAGVTGATAAAAPMTAATAASLGTAALAAPVGGAVQAGATGLIGTIAPAAAGFAVPSLGTALGAAGLVAQGGMGLYQAKSQEQMLKMQAEAEKRQAAAQQMQYQGQLRQVLSMNTADAAARGVAGGGGSFSAAQQSILEGGMIGIGQMQGDLQRKLALYSAARRNALMSGYGGAGIAGLQLGSYMSGGRII